MTKSEIRALRKRFMQHHKELMALNPIKIEIYECVSAYSHEKDAYEDYSNTPVIQINVWHSFIFDIRLIPKYFEGITVLHTTACDKTYEKFYHEDEIVAQYFIFEIEAPERYVRFVEKNYKQIMRKLKSPALTEYDMLNALTGGFESHIERMEKMRKEWLKDKRNEWGKMT